jgi:hypothetical protein
MKNALLYPNAFRMNLEVLGLIARDVISSLCGYQCKINCWNPSECQCTVKAVPQIKVFRAVRSIKCFQSDIYIYNKIIINNRFYLKSYNPV